MLPGICSVVVSAKPGESYQPLEAKFVSSKFSVNNVFEDEGGIWIWQSAGHVVLVSVALHMPSPHIEEGGAVFWTLNLTDWLVTIAFPDVSWHLI